MNKFIILPAIAISALLGADAYHHPLPTVEEIKKQNFGDFLVPHRHGVYLGLEGSYFKSRAYEDMGTLKTGDSMPGIELGYLYEAPQGICWRASLQYLRRNVSIHQKRESTNTNISLRYRFPLDYLTIAPMIGTQWNVSTLDRQANYLAAHSNIYAGVELQTQIIANTIVGLEAKVKSFYSHMFMYTDTNTLYGQNCRKFYGIDVDLPIRMVIDEDRTHEVELRPFYHYESLGNGLHKTGLQANIIHWF